MENKFLSLAWFKETAESAISKAVVNKLEKLIDDQEPVKEKAVHHRPYFSMKLVNDTLTIVLPDGDILFKPGATEEDYYLAQTAQSASELHAIVASREVVADMEKIREEEARIEALQQGIKTLEQLDDFIVEGNTVYLKGTSRSLPQLLVERFIQVVYKQSFYTGFGNLQEALNEDDNYLALKNFFMWCCLNPRAEVAHELYRFLDENSFRITKQGFVVALRNVVTLHGSPELVHFVSNSYNKVKAVWKQNPDNYTIFIQNGEYKLVHVGQLTRTEIVKSTECIHCDGEGGWSMDDFNSSFSEDFEDGWDECNVCNGTGEVEEYAETIEVHVDHGERLGTLTEIYLDLPNREENRFTDDWTKTFDIRIGQVTSMPQEECNWSTQDCAAAGLHFTADQIHYVGCGDQSVIVLINPMKVVGIGQHKGRCYEYLPIMTVPREEATTILHDGMFDTLQLDEEYAIRELESLVEKAKEGFATESKKYEFNMPSISATEINTIVLTLTEMKAKLADRVSIIK